MRVTALVSTNRNLLLGIVATVVASVVPLTPGAQAAPGATTNSNVVQRDALLSQLQRSDPQLAAAERSLTAVQAQLTASNATLAAENRRLVEVQSQMASNQQVLARAKEQLAQMMRVTYVSQGGTTNLAGSVFAADSFNQAFDRLRGAQTVSDQLAVLLKTVDQTQAALAREQTVLTAEQAATLRLESALAAQNSMLLATVAARDQLLTRAPARVVASVAKIDNANNAIAGNAPAKAAPVSYTHLTLPTKA